ncbi:uncharacterized protein LOC129611349 isoform X2 [Condylostylus longicornis]|nr:uncharacterized protein LOC129611349 isoform X2 [Condylostylus longicornis]
MKNDTYPTAVTRCASLIAAYPYPFFSGEYDWYFTGGNLACTTDFLLSSRGLNMNILNLSVVKSKRLKDVANIEYESNDVNAPTSEILEVQASNGIKNRFFVRCEKNITKYFYDESEATCVFNIERASVPFITFSEDPLNENVIITGDLNRQVFLWDVSRSLKKPISKLLSQRNEILERPDNWNCIRYFKINSFIYTDFEKFSLIDKQIESFVDDIDFPVIKDEIGTCEKICSLAVSNRFSNLIYIGTTHKVYAVDVRYLKKKRGSLILLKWTHQMKYPPLILKVHNCFESELIAASSPLYGEIRIFEVKKSLNEYSKKVYTSPYLPVSPPDFQNSYYFSKLQGECLDPSVDFESRIKKCTTGLEFFEKNNKVQLLISNSLGDVFSSRLINEEMEESKAFHTDIIKNYYEKVQKITRENLKELYVTDIKDMTNISKILRSTRLDPGDNYKLQNKISNKFEIDYENDPEKLIEIFPEKKRKLSKWEKTPTQYAECKDVLAASILKIWDFDIDKMELDVKKSSTFKEEQLIRVKDWVENIQKVYYKNNEFLGEPLEHEINLINNSEISKVPLDENNGQQKEIVSGSDNAKKIQKNFSPKKIQNNQMQKFNEEDPVNAHNSDVSINKQKVQSGVETNNMNTTKNNSNLDMNLDISSQIVLGENISDKIDKNKRMNTSKRKREYVKGF